MKHRLRKEANCSRNVSFLKLSFVILKIRLIELDIAELRRGFAWTMNVTVCDRAKLFCGLSAWSCTDWIKATWRSKLAPFKHWYYRIQYADIRYYYCWNKINWHDETDSREIAAKHKSIIRSNWISRPKIIVMYHIIIIIVIYIGNYVIILYYVLTLMWYSTSVW